MSKKVDDQTLTYIANTLQKMVDDQKIYKSYSDIDPIGASDLTTCISMVVRITDDALFCEPELNDKVLEKLNLSISNLLDAIEEINFQSNKKLAMIYESKSLSVPTDSKDLESLGSDLEKWRDASVELIDELDRKSAKTISRPKSWRSRYIARYVARFYLERKGNLPRNASGNPIKKYITAVDDICVCLKLDFPAAKYACKEVLNLFAKGEDLDPPIL